MAAGTPVASAQMAALREKIAWHYDQIAILKAQCNSLAPISEFPNELLSNIFLQYAVQTDSLFNLRWTDLMLVCRRWHEILRAHQKLWGFIQVVDNQPQKLKEQLTRSGAAPLSVHVVSCKSHTYAPMLLEHTHRLAELDFVGDVLYADSLIALLPSRSFPALHSLKIISGSRHRHSTQSHPILSDAFFDGRTPLIKRLQLLQVALRWKSMHRLHELSLTACRDTDPASFTTLLSVLYACPDLRILTLHENMLPHVGDVVSPAVPLHHLTSLSLHDSIESCIGLLRHILIPTTCRLSLTLMDTPLPQHLEALLFLLYVHHHAQTATPAQHIEFIRCEQGWFSIGVIAYAEAALPRWPLPTPLLVIKYDPGSESSRLDAIPQLLRTIPCSRVTQLTCGSAGFKIPGWKAVLELLPALTTVNIRVSEPSIDFLHTLTEIIESPPGSVIAYPSIHTISLRAYVYNPGNSRPDQVPPLLDALQRLLRLLHTRDTPLEILDIDNSGCLKWEEPIWTALFGLVGQLIRDRTVYSPPAIGPTA
ncbi:hypothetical protein C8J57DRAFT_1385545 [Mycena rebaudengoi]|nr:hypothetical protein C8J57DRAFT_1385545 [Mycena rebaudengoi]